MRHPKYVDSEFTRMSFPPLDKIVEGMLYRRISYGLTLSLSIKMVSHSVHEHEPKTQLQLKSVLCCVLQRA
jgi:hypothetical protein